MGLHLTFDWKARLSQVEKFERQVEDALSDFNSGHNASGLHESIRAITRSLFPVPYANQLLRNKSDSELINKGFVYKPKIFSNDVAVELLEYFSSSDESITLNAIEYMNDSLILHRLLTLVNNETGFNHIIWKCSFSESHPFSESPSNFWHYDNHYNDWTPKLMIYINSQEKEKGGTGFCNADLSSKISAQTNYRGLLGQREKFREYISDSIHLFNIDPISLELPHTRITPINSTDSVFFYPYRVLHKGFMPLHGSRKVLTICFTPLPPSNNSSIEQCALTSMSVLLNTLNNKMQKWDNIPYWKQ